MEPRAGSLYCWGDLRLPGRSHHDPVTASHPVRLEGLPALEGFTMVGDPIMGWDDA